MDIEEKIRQVPFGNSVFQIQHFVADQHTPERLYRSVLLQYTEKMKTLKLCSFRRRRFEIDIEEAEEKLKSTTGYDAKRLKIDIEEKQFGLEQELKLIEDCMIELKVYEDIINGLPEFTREEFEKNEPLYWKKRLLHDAELECNATGTLSVGTLQSLDRLGVKFRKIIEGTAAGKFVCIADSATLKELK